MNPDFIPSKMSKHTIYHSGFTGNTVWIDFENQNFFVILAARNGDYNKAKQGRLNIANAYWNSKDLTAYSNH